MRRRYYLLPLIAVVVGAVSALYAGSPRRVGFDAGFDVIWLDEFHGVALLCTFVLSTAGCIALLRRRLPFGATVVACLPWAYGTLAAVAQIAMLRRAYLGESDLYVRQIAADGSAELLGNHTLGAWISASLLLAIAVSTRLMPTEDSLRTRRRVVLWLAVGLAAVAALSIVETLLIHRPAVATFLDFPSSRQVVFERASTVSNLVTVTSWGRCLALLVPLLVTVHAGMRMVGSWRGLLAAALILMGVLAADVVGPRWLRAELMHDMGDAAWHQVEGFEPSAFADSGDSRPLDGIVMGDGRVEACDGTAARLDEDRRALGRALTRCMENRTGLEESEQREWAELMPETEQEIWDTPEPVWLEVDLRLRLAIDRRVSNQEIRELMRLTMELGAQSLTLVGRSLTVSPARLARLRAEFPFYGKLMDSPGVSSLDLSNAAIQRPGDYGPVEYTAHLREDGAVRAVPVDPARGSAFVFHGRGTVDRAPRLVMPNFQSMDEETVGIPNRIRVRFDDDVSVTRIDEVVLSAMRLGCLIVIDPTLEPTED